jgi:hypothetical protein
MSRARALERCRRFSDRRDEAEFDVRPEHPTISKSDEDVVEVEAVVRSDGSPSIRETAEELNISRGRLCGLFSGKFLQWSSCKNGLQVPHTQYFLSNISWQKKLSWSRNTLHSSSDLTPCDSFRRMKNRLGCAVAQAVSRWLPIAAARVCVRAARAFCGGQSGTTEGLLWVYRFPLPIIPTISPSL